MSCRCHRQATGHTKSAFSNPNEKTHKPATADDQRPTAADEGKRDINGGDGDHEEEANGDGDADSDDDSDRDGTGHGDGDGDGDATTTRCLSGSCQRQ